MIAKDILTKSYVKVGLDDSVAHMVGKMRRAKKHYALVFDGKKYLGMVGRKFLLTSRIDPSKMKVGNIVKKRSKSKTPFYVPLLKPDTDAQEVARLMATAGTHALPVEDKSKIIGVVQALDLAREIAPEYRKVASEELASMNLKTLNYDDEIGKALEMMHKGHIEHIPITDDRGKLAGLVAASNFVEEYVLWNAYTKMKLPRSATHQKGKRHGYGVKDKIHTMRVPIEQIMTPVVCQTNPTVKINTAIKKMVENNVTSIVLTRNNIPAGILTLNDVFKDYAK